MKRLFLKKHITKKELLKDISELNDKLAETRILIENKEKELDYLSTITEKGYSILELIPKQSLVVYQRYSNPFIDIFVDNYSKQITVVKIQGSILGDDLIEIDDITSYEVNKGYGSLAMKHLQKFASFNKKNISGWISPVDKDHHDRLIAYYKNHNFVISYNHQNEPVSIFWEYE